MGCSSSKAIQDKDNDSVITATISPEKPERLYRLVVKAQKTVDVKERSEVLNEILEHTKTEPKAASYCNPNTKSTPLHMACRLLDTCSSSDKSEQALLSSVIDSLSAASLFGNSSIQSQYDTPHVVDETGCNRACQSVRGTEASQRSSGTRPVHFRKDSMFMPNKVAPSDNDVLMGSRSPKAMVT